MKRVTFITLLSLLMLSTTFAQKPDTPFVGIGPLIPDTTSVTFTKVYKDVKGAIEGLASGLKVGATHVYLVLVKQQYINAWIWIILGGVGIILAITGVILLFGKEEIDDMRGIPGIILGILGLAFFFICICNLDAIITGFANPEYGALKEIIKLVHQ